MTAAVRACRSQCSRGRSRAVARFAALALRLRRSAAASPATAPCCAWLQRLLRRTRHTAARIARGTSVRRLARPGRLRRLRASPRLIAAALRASPVTASPFTVLRTAPCSSVRASAVAPAGPLGTVLRTRALARVGEAVRSSAAAAPLRRVPRRRFPHPQCCAFRSSRPPGAALGLTPHASVMQVARTRVYRAFRVSFGASERLAASDSCWTERISHRYTAIVIAQSPQVPACPPPIYGRHATDMRANTLQTPTDTRPACAEVSRSGPPCKVTDQTL